MRITDQRCPDSGCELCGLPHNTHDLIQAMKDGVAIRIADLEAEIERLRTALESVMVETNFISLQAARSYISEILDASRRRGGR